MSQIDGHLHGQARVQSSADAARQPRLGHARGLGHGAVAADELEAIPAERALPFAAVEEGDARREFARVGVARHERSAARIDLADHVRRVRRAVLSEDQLEEPCQRQPPRAARAVA